MAVEAVVSLIVRPGAGVLADRHDRSLVAAGGAALSAGAFALYAVASSIEVVGVGAALGGAGGALFWVALRADVGLTWTRIRPPTPAFSPPSSSGPWSRS
ncbi:MAG: hypothetical protein M3550_09675 [Actinomycetota bacterium]|nr:hypothetical protein [Actinomycetota bacterium]